MNLKNIISIVIRILKQFKNDKRTVALFFIVPLIILSLLGYMLLGQSTNLTLGLNNQDNGFLGKEFSNNLLHNKDINIKIENINQLKKDLLSNKIQGYIIFPSNFTNNFLMNHTISSNIYLEGSQPQEVQNLLSNINKAYSIKGMKVKESIHYLYGNSKLNVLDYFGPAFIGIIVFFLVFLITSVSFLRERSEGTLERLIASPLSKTDIVFGYMIAFILLSFVQAVIVLLFSLYVLNMYNIGNILYILIIEFLLTISAVNTGIFLSMFSKTEFQAIQFIPLVIIPQVLLSGIIFTVNTEPPVLKTISNILPLTYAVQGLRIIMIKGKNLDSHTLILDIIVLIIFSLLMLLGAFLTIKNTIDTN